MFLGWVTLLLMRNLSLRLVKYVYGPARFCQALSNINKFLHSCPYVNKKREVVDKDLLRCYIKFIPQILKVLLTKPYKRLWKKLNQILVVHFIPKLLF